MKREPVGYVLEFVKRNGLPYKRRYFGATVFRTFTAAWRTREWWLEHGMNPPTRTRIRAVVEMKP
jgi:hypothetical protein